VGFEEGVLVDRFGRGLTDLRVSLTNRCNFHCVYCHDEGLGETQPPRAPAPDEMTADEVVGIIRVGAKLGVSRVKFTGGEPMLRADLEEIVARTSPFVETSLTTNGSLLAARATGLRAAGLSRVNVSLDSLDPHHFQTIRKGSLAPVLAGIDAALAAGLAPVKINTVVFDETVRDIPGLLQFVSEREGLELQLIELMPEIRHDMADHSVAIREVQAWLEAHSDQTEMRAMHHRRKYRIGKARVELVDPVGNAEFCANCHRVRVTHDGKLKGCLNILDGLVPTRGASEAEIEAAFRRVVHEREPYYRRGLDGAFRPATVRLGEGRRSPVPLRISGHLPGSPKVEKVAATAARHET
jgi:cyclic pyranopterin phosphate synthase